MTQEDKLLLLADLCGRLPYEVKCGNTLNHRIGTLSQVSKTEIITLDIPNYDECFSVDVCRIKPYLRLISSITEEEKVQLSQYACIGEDLNGEFIDEVQRKDCAAYIDWLNKHHFDYRGLIEKGLALEALEGMYK